MQHRVLVVDDELGMRETLEIILQNAGYDVSVAGTPEAACALLENEHFDAVLTDLYMGNDRQAGMKLLTYIQEHAPHTPAIMMTAYGSVDTAIEAMRRGAVDYIQKPFKSNDEIRIRVKQAIAQRILIRENEALRMEQARRGDLENMIGQSPAFRELIVLVRKVATLPSTVALHGESGAGKELVARALHQLSNRGDKPFVAINCGGIPENLLESELFGYKRGAFTGATEDKEGLFVVANGGTVFLDEIGEMPVMLQAKLLRVLDNQTITPVGGVSEVRVDVRIISATNRDLEAMVEQGKFRSDLYYRLNVIPIPVPPLRERRDDIPMLVRHFIQKHSTKIGRPALQVSPEALDALVRYDWPGNVRELGNVLERVVALCGNDQVEFEDLPREVREFLPSEVAVVALPAEGVSLEDKVAALETSLIKQALERSRYSQKKAAELLGLTPRSLRYRLQKYGLEAD
ncbi:MAG: sigma-54-dependent Fis family transcriptional regulator [Candidatus Hydrogenedentes bacterium]|nr:sigma-54-dependent Fis family transcriptional regulator [Candidatus Hydrogenedentota bacterium]